MRRCSPRLRYFQVGVSQIRGVALEMLLSHRRPVSSYSKVVIWYSSVWRKLAVDPLVRDQSNSIKTCAQLHVVMTGSGLWCPLIVEGPRGGPRMSTTALCGRLQSAVGAACKATALTGPEESVCPSSHPRNSCDLFWGPGSGRSSKIRSHRRRRRLCPALVVCLSNPRSDHAGSVRDYSR